MSFFAGIFGSGKSQAQQANAAAGLQIQTSVQGKPIALVYGTTRIAPNLIWYGDFTATQASSSSGAGKGGVGGGGGGKGGGGSSGYTYSASFQAALCEGAINGIWNVYVDKNITNLPAQGLSFFSGARPQAPWSYQLQPAALASEVHTIPGSGPFTVTVNQAGQFLQDQSATLLTSTTFTQVAGTPASGQYRVAITNSPGYSSGAVTGQYTFNLSDAGKNVVITYQLGRGGPHYTYPVLIPAGGVVIIPVPFGSSFFGNVSVTSTGTPLVSVPGAPASGQYNAAQSGVYTFNSAQAGDTVTIVYYPFAGAALGYSGTAYVAAAHYPLGNSPQLPNFNFEVAAVLSNQIQQEITGEQYAVPSNLLQQVRFGGTDFVSDFGVIDQDGNVFTRVFTLPTAFQYFVNITGTTAGTYQFNAAQAGTIVNINYQAAVGPDADPAGVIYDLLTSVHYGAGFPVSRMASLVNYQNYVLASGLVVSPAYQSQSAASSMLDDLSKATNSAFVWSSGLLSVVPYGDSDITANGHTYTAPSVPLFDIDDDDYLPNTNSTGGASAVANSDPVLLTRLRPSDAFNSIKLEWLDRGNNYDPAIIEAKDQASINTFGLRQDSVRQFHQFCNGFAARLSVQLQMQRQTIRNTYSFTLDQRYVLLDPMDIITLTDANLGLNKQWVRITEITENDDRSLSFTAEDYLQGTGTSPRYSYQGNTGFIANYNTDPGNANPPIIYEPPVIITDGNALQAWIGCSGGTNWGGCDIFISTDGSTYKLAGRVSGPARQGLLTANLASSADPDQTHTLAVDLSMSLGQLQNATQADADLFHTLCLVDGELISYEQAVLTAANNYALTYLRRGVYGTPIGAHLTSSNFLRLDEGVFHYQYDKSKIGQTIYVKLLSFNQYGGGEQALSDVSPYTHVLTGPPLSQAVQQFTAQQQGAVVVFGWLDLINDVGLKGYDIAFGAPGTSWAQKQLLTEAHRGTEMTNAAVPPGAWEFSIRGHDIADNLGPESLVQLAVTNLNPVILSQPQEPDWAGIFGIVPNPFIKYPGGILVPDSQYLCSQYVELGSPPAPALYQDPGGSLPATTYYIQITYVDSGGESTSSVEVVANIAANALLAVGGPPNPTSAPDYAVGYNVYVGLTSGSETLQNSAPIAFGQYWGMPTSGLVAGVAPPTLDTTGWQVFDKFVPDPGADDYFTPTYDTGFDDTLRVYSTVQLVPGPGEMGNPTFQFQIDTWLTGQTDMGIYIPWTSGYLLMRYIVGLLFYIPVPGSVSYIKDFTLIADKVPVTQNASSVTIAPGGTAVTFPTPYHTTPFMPAPNVVSPTGSGFYATAVSISTTGATIHVWDHTGTDVGGVVNWSANGE